MIAFLYNILFFTIPLIFLKNTSELFEFNKIVILYLFTTLIVSVWAIESIRQRKIIFKKTQLDIPIIVYLVILLISSLISIDPRTSWFGYYSRFNGGLFSQICYSLLYWAFVSNLNAKNALNCITALIISTGLSSLLAIGEHFGFFTTCASISYTDLHRPENVQTLEKFNLLNNTEKFNYLFKNNCWVQDVQTRVFSTLGQPNWLAALLVALLPISLIYSLKNKFYMLVSILFFTTLIFTKSRSGFLAFGVEFLILWGYLFWKEKMKYIKEFIFITLSFSLLTFFFLTKSNNSTITMPNSGGPALETGGTESGSIRKYVWIGALNIFLKNPLLGTGPETFAFSFPTQKPTDHNLTSEWDFIYNKAHNEFLNILSNTGIVGFTAYILIVISTISILILKNKNADPNYYNIALLSSFVSILVTNFFGFSVVIISLLFYLIPAISVTLDVDKIHRNNTRQSLKEKLYLLTITIITITILTKIFNYWRSDIYYNSSKKKQDIDQINKAISLTPKEPIFLAHRSLLTGSTEDSFNAYKMSLYNQNIRRIYISNLVKNTSANQSNLYRAEEILLEGIKISPNDPRLYYQIGILQLKFGKNVEGIKNLQKAVELKPNYKEVRFALGSLFKEINENDLARQEFEYILNNIDPYDELTKNQLEELK